MENDIFTRYELSMIFIKGTAIGFVIGSALGYLLCS